MNKFDKIMIYIFAFSLIGVLFFIGYQLTLMNEWIEIDLLSR